MKTNATKNSLLRMVQFAMLLGIEAIFCFTVLGSLPIGPMVATLAMLPVIVAALLLGTGAGAAMGFFAGLFSFIVWTYMPPNPALAFVFTPFYSLGEFQGNGWSLVICFVPRILVGVVTGLSYQLLSRLTKTWRLKNALVYGLSGALGSLTNTIPVLLGIYVFFGPQYATANQVAYAALLGIIGFTIATNGVLEAVLGALTAYGVCPAVKKMTARMR